jgi:major membrane immunogen (membrane-anchored lipoprotein)
MMRKLALLFSAAVLLAACAEKPKTMVAAPGGAWISLFNGKDLDNWTVKIAGHDVNDNYRNTFRAEDGMLKVSYQDYDKFDNSFGSLFTKQKFSHYWLRAEYRFVGSLVSGAPSWAYKNSGLQLHSQAPETMRKEQQFPISVEFDIVGAHFYGRPPTGDVCQNGTHVLIQGAPVKGYCSKLSDVALSKDDWVTVLAEVDGSKRVRQIVNGALIVEYTDLELDQSNQDARRLIAAGAGTKVDSGYISIQSNGYPIEFRRIEVLPLDAGASERGS